MHTIRRRIIMIIAFIIVLLCVANLAISLSLTRNNMYKLTSGDMKAVADIADEYVTSSINLLKAEVVTVEKNLSDADQSKLKHAMLKELQANPKFIGFTVIDKSGIVVSAGEHPTAPDLIDSEYIKLAFTGKETISTTRKEADGYTVFHVCVPMNGNRVLSGTIDGMYFTNILHSLRIWKTGKIFMLDKSGTVIADTHKDFVLNRLNIFKKAKTDDSYKDLARFCEGMVRGDETSGTYVFEKIEKISVSTPVFGSNVGWTLAVVAPVAETPLTKMNTALWRMSGIFLLMGLIVAVIASFPIAKPIAVIKKQNAELEELKVKAESASETKSNFLANTSHEMRTPLNAIIGFSQLQLDRKDIDDESRENFEKISLSGHTMLNIVNDLLDISKIESGKLEIIETKYDVASMVNDTTTLNIMRLGSKPIEFKINVDPEIPAYIMGDELRTKQLFNNLLSNAFKYTKEGSVTWTLSSETVGDKLWLIGSVKDTGIGIKEEDIGKLFTNYNQVDTKSNRTIEGTGLGLAIVKKLTGLMGGEVSVKSTYGEGTEFHVRILHKAIDSPKLGTEVAEKLSDMQYANSKQMANTSIARVDLSYAHILVVDDVATNLDVARGMMRPYGMKIDCAQSGRKAIELIEKGETYDAIFMDHMMPEMDGIEAVRIIRNEVGTEYAKNVPIIALTANAIAGNREMFLSKGFNGFVSKPIDIKMLDAALRQWVYDSERAAANDDKLAEEDTAASKEAVLSAEEPAQGTAGNALAEIDGLDYEAGLARFGGDADIYAEVLSSFAANTRPLLADLERYRAEGNLADYAVAVHGIKGSSRGICAEEIGNRAEALEKAAKAADADTVNAGGGEFAADVEKFLGTLAAALDSGKEQADMPSAPRPSEELVARLIEACDSFDMDEADEILTEMEKSTYEDAEIVPWLRNKLNTADFREIAAKLRDY